MLQFCTAVVGVADETKTVVLEVGKRVDGGFTVATVGVLPILEDGIDSETNVHAESGGISVISYHIVASAVDVEHTHGGYRRLRGVRIGNQSADGCAGVDAVAVFNGHAVRHKAAHGNACKEDTVGVKLILNRQRVEERHQEADVINGAGGQTSVPHST